ncbi:MAG: hypothetical protein HYZ54_03395 [Ignavibacteriae bacterium]|nr:hypothetical protein [Ignavibacteriota bacterium]
MINKLENSGKKVKIYLVTVSGVDGLNTSLILETGRFLYSSVTIVNDIFKAVRHPVGIPDEESQV